MYLPGFNVFTSICIRDIVVRATKSIRTLDPKRVKCEACANCPGQTQAQAKKQQNKEEQINKQIHTT